MGKIYSYIVSMQIVIKIPQLTNQNYFFGMVYLSFFNYYARLA
jgi:hypothetical protein